MKTTIFIHFYKKIIGYYQNVLFIDFNCLNIVTCVDLDAIPNIFKNCMEVKLFITNS